MKTLDVHKMEVISGGNRGCDAAGTISSTMSIVGTSLAVAALFTPAGWLAAGLAGAALSVGIADAGLSTALLIAC